MYKKWFKTEIFLYGEKIAVDVEYSFMDYDSKISIDAIYDKDGYDIKAFLKNENCKEIFRKILVECEDRNRKKVVKNENI